MKPLACYLFVCLVLSYTRPPLTETVTLSPLLSSVTFKFCHHGHQSDLHIRGFNFAFLLRRCQNWNTSTMCRLVPEAQLLVMEIEFPKVWMGNQWFRCFSHLVERRGEKIPRLHKCEASLRSNTKFSHRGINKDLPLQRKVHSFSIWSGVRWPVSDHAGDTPTIYRLWSHMHVCFPISNQGVRRSHQVCQLVPM